MSSSTGSRHLSPAEIDTLVATVLNEYATVHSLPERMRTAYAERFRAWLVPALERVQIYPEGIPRLQETLRRKYRLVEPAKSVGIICGQSIGEMQTQTTLNTFHKCGLTEKLVVAGVPRFLEIIDTNRSETQGTPSAYVYFRDPVPESLVAARARVGHTLARFLFQDLYTHRAALTAPADWYTDTERLRVAATGGAGMRYELNLDRLFRHQLPLATVARRLVETLVPQTVADVVFSPLALGCVDVWTRGSVNALEDDLHPQIVQVPICGLDRVQNMFFMKDTTAPGGWYVETDGSNLEAILALDYVDTYRTYSNDIWEIYALFGVEAVRSYIVEELTNLMPTIHPTHIDLLADRMTVSGRLRSISRYTRKHEQSSVLSKATFEETLSGFLRSALLNEVDTVNGASASIICGKVPRVGTGLVDLLIDGPTG
jgi:DNA-directed RNA polymerase subunit A"